MQRSRLIVFWLVCLFPALMRAETPDWSIYNALLADHVSTHEAAGITLNWVDYTAMGRDTRYEQLISQVQNFMTSKLASDAERLGFYINVYNIYAIKMVIDHWPLESIKDAGSFFKPVWKKPVGVLDGRMTTLHEIEHDILRKMNEPRIHMAIVCASLSCPDLRKTAFTAGNIDAELEQATQDFLNNTAKGYRVAGDGIIISKIFDWFDDDFESSGGVTGFLARYVELPSEQPGIDYLDYNWQLNGE